MLAGRGFGKTLMAANWILDQAMKHPGTKWGVASPTTGELDAIVFQEESGLLRQALPGEIKETRPGIVDYNKNKNRLDLTNGSTIQGYTMDSPERIRGANLYGLWIDELASARRQDEFWKIAYPAVRRGDARVLITTTPRTTPLLRRLVDRDDVHVVTGRMAENTDLQSHVVQALLNEFQGTRWAASELEGILLDDFEGALFKREHLDNARVDVPPELDRVVIGLDPAMKGGEAHDESGIVVVGEVGEHAYVLADESFKGTSAQVASTLAKLAAVYEADCFVVEGNQGGDWITDTLRTVNPNARIKVVHARKGKAMRAEPVAALSEQGRLHLVGVYPELEDELCCLIPGEVPMRSPDRADALVWAVYELRGLTSGGGYMAVYGMVACPNCKQGIRKEYKRCPNCQAEVVPVKDEPKGQRSPWAKAYMDECPNGHLYSTVKFRRCPECSPDPNVVIGQAQQLRQYLTNGGKPNYKTPGLASIWRRTTF